jgi:hypothetical protein
LAESGAKRRFAITHNIPGDTNARRNGMIVVVFKGSVLAGNAAEETRILAEMGSGNYNKPITRVGT